MNKEEKTICKNLIQHSPFDTYNDHQFFDSTILARKYAKLFGINPDKNWIEAFRIVTEGQGGEISKINSLISSSLLSLLVFHKLFNNANSNISIKIPDDAVRNYRFNRCFYEIRNKVITSPSCVDVVLYSENDNILLFLESKFTEYFSVHKKKDYGQGYISLYKDYLQNALSGYIEIEDELNGEKRLLLKSSDKKPIYIEGIKQTISHLIGLVRGPYEGGGGYYPEPYYTEYNKIFKDPEVKLYYGTILYDPTRIMPKCDQYVSFNSLYQNIIAGHASEILKGICDWNDKINKDANSESKSKSITILKSPITYQSLFENGINDSLLTNEVKDFYSL